MSVQNQQECLSVCKNGRHYIGVSQHANIWLGKLFHLPGGSKIVSLKEIRRGCVQKQQALILDRLREYVLVAQKFDHANVGHVFGLSDGHGPLPLLVLPHFSNGNVIDYLKSNPGKTDEEKTELAKGILAGLSYLHRGGIIHGAVRGENVLVNDDGIAILCDAQFDSIVFGQDEYCFIRSDCWWMSRERLVADNDADDNYTLASPSMPADMYGAALTIGQLWTMQRPFYDIRNKYEFVMKLRELKAGQPAQVDRPEAVPVSVWSLLQDCLMTEPQARPTAEGLLASFEIFSE